ncbi:MAG: DNA topoisomerase [Candidatus Altiarchaeota archaeon]
MKTLVITEKPNVAERIANSLGKASRRSHGGVDYFEVGDLVVAPAVGHIFGLRERNAKGWTYPVFDVEWVPSHLVSKNSDYTKRYLDNIKFLAKNCGSFINACDYDVEGEVIGYNVIKHGCGADPRTGNVKRVKFSTLTSDAIIKSFENVGPIDYGLADAGITRHVLDWYWGINLSRALSNAARRGRSFTTLSIGRVQGPTLKILADRERAIMAFRSERYWEVEMLCHKDMDFSAMYEAGKYVFSLAEKIDVTEVEGAFRNMGLLKDAESMSAIVKDDSDESVERWNATSSQGTNWILTREREDKKDLLKVMREDEEGGELALWIEPDTGDPTRLKIFQGEINSGQEAKRIKANCGPKALVKEVGSKRYNQPAPHPFDLTTLQTEAYRHLGVDPRVTLEIAQELYTNAYISYPRTSSQQIPADIDCRKILSQLKSQATYSSLCSQLLSEKELKPANGPKNDPAHPAIHPTGEEPKALEGQKKRVYDLIVRRFMATFGEPAVRQTITVRLENNGEPFLAKGNTTVEKGWHVYYGPYARFEENELPNLKRGEEVFVKDVIVHEKETKPPKRYTPASIIREMEKNAIGTKATRSQIVDILFKRGYVNGKSLEVSPLGLSVVDAMGKYCPEVISVQLTRRFESDMDEITSGRMKSEAALEDGKKTLEHMLKEFKANESNIGQTLISSVMDSRKKANSVGKCPKCGNELLIRASSLGGLFVGCGGYPNCTQTWPLPKDPLTKTGECKECGYAIVTAKPKGRGRKYSMCVNPECKTRKNENGKSVDEVGLCPKCQSRLLVRTSRYGGLFIGCSGYPKCTNLWPLPKDPFEKSGKCESCGYVTIEVSPSGKEKYIICVNPDCGTRKK